jgi:hypothetical protein
MISMDIHLPESLYTIKGAYFGESAGKKLFFKTAMPRSERSVPA